MDEKKGKKFEQCIRINDKKEQLDFEDIMNFWPCNKYIYQDLREEIEDVVPLVGAGLTQNVVKDDEENYLTWEKLLKKCAENLGDVNKAIIERNINQGKYEEAAQEIVNIIGKGGLLSLIKAQYNPKNIDPIKLGYNPIKVFPHLFDNLILTTNYDKTIEFVYEKVKKMDLLLPNSKKRDFVDVIRKKKKGCALYKFHGDIEESLEDIILTKDSYDSKYGTRGMADESNETELVRNLSFCLLAHPILFLGCGLKNDRIMDLIVKNREVHHFAFVACGAETMNDFNIEDATNEAIIKNIFLDKKNIRAIFYPRYDRGCVKKLLDELLKYKNQISNDGRYYEVFQIKKEWMNNFFSNLKLQVTNNEINSIKKHIVIFGGIFTEIREYNNGGRAKDNIDNLCNWLQDNQEAKLFICYDSEEAALYRAKQTKKNKTTECIVNKIKSIRKIPLFFKEEVRSRVYLIPIVYSLTGYSVLTDSDLYWNIITQNQSAEGPILKIIEEMGESGKLEKLDKIGYMIYALQESKRILDKKRKQIEEGELDPNTLDPVLNDKEQFINAIENMDKLDKILGEEQEKVNKSINSKPESVISDRVQKICITKKLKSENFLCKGRSVREKC